MTERQKLFAGCLLGGAIGDALGAPLEFLSLREIRARYGGAGLSSFVPAYGRAGAITDDTQMTIYTAEGLLLALQERLSNGVWQPVAAVHQAYLRWLKGLGLSSAHPDFVAAQTRGLLPEEAALREYRSPGRTCLTALRDARAGSVAEPLNQSKGCGGIMRIVPVGLICASGRLGESALRLGCEVAALTHGHPSGYLAAGVFAEIIARLGRGEALPGAIPEAAKRLACEPQHEECLLAIERALAAANRGEAPAPEIVERLGQGWTADEALAIALYCALVARDFRHGVSLAANHSGDSDSTAALTGNLLGMRWGYYALPPDLRENVELRELLLWLAAQLDEALEALGV